MNLNLPHIPRAVVPACTVIVATALGAGAIYGLHGGGGPLAGASKSSDVLELRVRYGGKSASYFSDSHEWYSPRTGLFRAEHQIRGKTYVQVYDGTAITTTEEDGLTRQAGRRAMLQWVVRGHDLGRRIGVTVVEAYLFKRKIAWLRIDRHSDGSVIKATMKFSEDAPPVPLRVRVVSRMSLAEAKRKHIFAPPPGVVVEELRESAPGSPPSFGEPAYWFGRRLGEARAAATLESSHKVVAAGAPSIVYKTVYRLPESIASPVAISSGVRVYPGLGEKPPSDIWVGCSPRVPGRPPPTAIGRRESAVVKGGERVALTIAETVRADRRGVQAMIVLSDAFCSVEGLVSSAVLKRSLSGFGPP